MGHYRNVAVETYRNPGERSSASLRARLLPGQGLSTEMKVEFSRRIREAHPQGTVFIIQAQVTDRQGTPFVYSSYQWACEVVPRATAIARIAAGTL